MTLEEKAEANAKASKAKVKRRGQMTPEERDKARADDTTLVILQNYTPH